MDDLLAERLNMLDEIAADMMRVGADNKRSIAKLQKLIDDRDRFIMSTVQSISLNHADFIRLLHERGLTEREIGLCSLFCIGLSVKEAGDYMGTSSIYNLTSAIRRKLGIPRQETNLDIYVRKKMKNL